MRRTHTCPPLRIKMDMIAGGSHTKIQQAARREPELFKKTVSMRYLVSYILYLISCILYLVSRILYLCIYKRSPFLCAN